ncbi:amidase [Kribbella sp. NPDC026596]|uniref:amidase n=1 Tax=Kribbella sp. NPDC026596 TaxID=3155122 RepID=UPI00340BEA8A
MTSELCDLSATEQLDALRSRAVSARELLGVHLERIEQTNPDVNAIVTLVPEQAMAAAAAADDLAAAGGSLGPLHGLPVAHKDTHSTAGIRTTFGSRIHARNVPDTDDLIIARMKAAGVITIGKTNTPEFAAGSHTFNEIFGVTRNPYDLTRSAGGSSGGAAAALACGMHPIADGSDMGGSLRNPAAWCNVVGFRPSPGRVPTFPAALPWGTLGVQGPMARTVADAALLLSVIAGPDRRSPLSLQDPGSDFAVPLDRDLTGLRVAWSPDLGGAVPVDTEITDVLTEQVGVFEDLGCTVEEACPDFTGAEEVFRTLRAWQFEAMLGEAQAAHPDLFKSSLAWNIDEGRRLTGPDIGRAERLHAGLFHRVREFFEQYDVLLLPVTQVSPFPVEQEYPTEIAGVPQTTYLDWMRSVYFVSTTGAPALSVPAGFTPAGLPVGLQFVGRHRDDLGVLQVGHAFEQATNVWRVRPTL